MTKQKNLLDRYVGREIGVDTQGRKDYVGTLVEYDACFISLEDVSEQAEDSRGKLIRSNSESDMLVPISNLERIFLWDDVKSLQEQ